MRKTKIFIVTLLLILSFSIIAYGEETTNVKFYFNGNPLNIPQEYGYPFIDAQSRTMIPLRIIAENLGHKVGWDDTIETAIIDDSIYITIGEKIIKTPDGYKVMDTFAILKPTGTSAGSRTYVPLRFVVEALGYEVEYKGPNASNNYNHVVNIYSPDFTPGEGIETGNEIQD